ncbi:MAG: hypothetical protein A2W23_02820 [Planctomycetes bacterium RBG_16_43_13]|nr:MAG: hypothetical protein A2W23_02820 [Planctomycetes bacterium RBG_16_43_13]
MTNNFYAVVMAGGSGTRFWPISRHNKPKQLIPLISHKSLLRETVERLSPLFKPNNILVITNIDQVEMARNELPMLPPENIMAEPVGRDTAPCVGYAAAFLEWREPGSIFCAIPADHYIHPKDKFQKTLSSAYKAAEQNNIVTIGIKPNYPATVYGYLQRGEPLSKQNHTNVFKLRRFCEKPSEKVAQKFVDSGEFYWNSGIFIWKAKTILDNIKKFLPHLYKGLITMMDYFGTSEQDKIVEREYNKFTRVSIDYGVMERAENVVMVEADFEWDDVGSFLAVAKYKKKDKSGNIADGLTCGIDNDNTIILSINTNHLIGAIGLKDVLIVHTDDATLICPKDRASDVKKLIEKIKEEKSERFL